MHTPEITAEMLVRYDRPGPRYTSYPTVPEWLETFSAVDFRRALYRASKETSQPLSLYCHIPFCERRCAYCGCNTIVGAGDDAMDRYIDHIRAEMSLAAEYLKDRCEVTQCHWGGGTPTRLSLRQMTALFAGITSLYSIHRDAEIALETNPNTVTEEQIRHLRALGFNRISFGVQDLAPEVQRAIGRNQDAEGIRKMTDFCRELGFSGINMDLIYGLPLQQMAAWEKTMEGILAMRPDRVALYSYAHLPQRFEHQRILDKLPRPDTAEKYALFAFARRVLLEAGYRAIGMDHFAVPEDELALSLEAGTLNRNFMGYTVSQAPDQIGFGLSAISEIGGCYSQNQKAMPLYEQALRKGEFPVDRGMTLSSDDLIRRWTIRRLMCSFVLDHKEASELFQVDSLAYFEEEHKLLKAYEDEGMILLGAYRWQVTPLGMPFIRNICMIFDAYLGTEGKTLFSRTI